VNIYPGMSDAEFEAEIQKEAQRLNREFERFVRSGKSYEEFLLEGDIAAFEKTLRQRQKEEQNQAPPATTHHPTEAQSHTILKTIDQLLADLEDKKEYLSENPKFSTESNTPVQTLDDVLQKAQKDDPDPLDFLDDL
jgi:hypothetical protein